MFTSADCECGFVGIHTEGVGIVVLFIVWKDYNLTIQQYQQVNYFTSIKSISKAIGVLPPITPPEPELP